MAFEQGKSGNPGGRPKGDKQFRDALNVAIKRTEGDKTMLAHIAEALVCKAMLGDVPAINAIADRLDGKPNQALEVTHDGEITLKSAVVSQLNGFFADTAGRLTDQSDADVVPN